MTQTIEAPPRPTAVLAPACEEWLAGLAKHRGSEGMELVRKACELASAAHSGQTRASGEDYIAHPIAVAGLLDELNLDPETLVAAILHDVVEDTGVTLDEVRTEFGPKVAHLVDGVTKMDAIDDLQIGGFGKAYDRKQVTGLRKLLLAVVEDVRVVLVKLADRLHNMRTLAPLPDAKRCRIARETLDIYAPLAGRLGIWRFKWEMEDLSFRYLDPAVYQRLARQLDERRSDRERYIASVASSLSKHLEEAGISAEVFGRPKHIYSIWRKMQSKGLEFRQVLDQRGVRVLVDSVADCYAALGLVHALWPHVPREFDDYIANPKRNHYQSLHTAVVGPEGKTVEVQIRTRQMHHHAEYGVAAHWRYKEKADKNHAFEEKVTWLRQVLEWKDDSDELGAFMDRFEAEVLHDRVYVMTPRGQVIDLPTGATPVDFAYHIHTDVGHRCRGAKVDGSIVPLTYTLQSGQKVEVLTTRQGGPSRDWLNPNLGYIKTTRARGRIRHWFKEQDYEKNLAAGKDALEREFKRLGIKQVDTDKLLSRFNLTNYNDLLAAVGHGDVTTTQVANSIQDLVPKTPEQLLRVSPTRQPHDGDTVRIEGVGNLLTNFARCCRPVPNDAILGYITRGRGVTIHRKDCSNILRLAEDDRARLIDVSWSVKDQATYPVDIQVTAYDRQGLLRDITAVVANEHINVLSMNLDTDGGKRAARMLLTIEVTDLAQLSRVLDRVTQLPNVVDARRRV